jgi:hypothetical protein
MTPPFDPFDIAASAPDARQRGEASEQEPPYPDPCPAPPRHAYRRLARHTLNDYVQDDEGGYEVDGADADADADAGDDGGGGAFEGLPLLWLSYRVLTFLHTIIALCIEGILVNTLITLLLHYYFTVVTLLLHAENAA